MIGNWIMIGAKNNMDLHKISNDEPDVIQNQAEHKN